VAAVEVHRRALLDHAREKERAQQGGHADHDQGAAEHPEDERVQVVAVVALEQFDDPDAGDRRGDAAHREPERQPLVDRAELQVLVAAERLRHGGVEDVGPDRGHRLDPEDQDQQRGHQRRAAHAGHPDQQADAESEQHDGRVDAQTENVKPGIHCG
jgi:hypothetical protein